MNHVSAARDRNLVCRLATSADRERIYAIRHEVYARELGQHRVNAEGRLEDELDARNAYALVATARDVVAFISVTPPGGRYSIDKYFARESLPFPVDDGLFEMRILTVVREARGSAAAVLLLYAALRHIEEHGGRHIALIGRADLVDYYEKFAVERTGRVVRSGAVDYELMHGPIDRVARNARSRIRPSLERALRSISWELPYPPALDAPCEHGGASFAAIGVRLDDPGKRHRVVPADVLDAWFTPAPRVIEALREDLPWLAQASPPTHAEGLIATIADARGLSASSLAVGSGSSDLIFRALPRWMTRAARALVVDPSYGEYAHVLEHVIGCRVDRFVLARENGFALDLDAWSARLASGRYDLAVLVNPANPTGHVHERATLLEALRRVPPTTRVWIDEAYVDYAEALAEGAASARVSIERDVASLGNVVVCKSLSKVFALSGLRAAYLVAPPALASALRRVTPPWPVSLPAQLAAMRAFAEAEYYRARWQETHELGRGLEAALRDAGFAVLRGAINAVIASAPEGAPDSAAIAAAARREGVFVRDLATLSGVFGGRAVRVAVRSRAENERIATVLAAALSTRITG